MGTTIILQDEDGEPTAKVEMSRQLLQCLLPPASDTSYPLLRFVDSDGNTYFNRLQMPQFISEWERTASRATSPDDAQVVAQVEELARQCEREVHMYLKFEGD